MTHQRMLPPQAADAASKSTIPQTSYDFTDPTERELFRLTNDIVKVDPALASALVEDGLQSIPPSRRDAVRRELGV